MEKNWLELKVMYCKDLKLFNFFQKLSVYALVSIDNNSNNDDDDNDDKSKNENQKPKLKLKKQQHRTPTDTEGDANPEWNYEMRFDLGDDASLLHDFNDDDDDCLFLHFDLRSEATGLLALGGDRSIGEVWVPLKDLIQPSNLGIARFVNYEVRTVDGKSNGVINFSFKLNFKQNYPNLPTINVHGYPILHHHNESNNQNPSSPATLYPTSPSLSSYPSLNLEFGQNNRPDFYYDAVSSPVTPYSPQQGYYQHPHPHQFSPLRPPPPVAYPHQFSQPQPPPQPLPYAYPPPPPPTTHEYQQTPSPNWAQYPKPPDPLYGIASGGGGYDYGHGPGSPVTPIGGQGTTWPNHFRPGGHHFAPSWNSR